MCSKCEYSEKDSKEKQKCVKENCTAKYCYTATVTDASGTKLFRRRCDNDKNMPMCPDPKNTCQNLTKADNLKSCLGVCCKTDNCNNYSLGSATGVMATKYLLCVLVIAGFLFA